MKLNIHIQNLNGGDITSKCSIGNFQIELEANMSAWDRMTSAEEQRKFIDNQIHILDYHQQNPDAIKGYVKAMVGGIAGGVIEAIDEQVNPATKLRRKITRWLDAINPMKRWEKARHREDCGCHCNSKNAADDISRFVKPGKVDFAPADEQLASALAGTFNGSKEA